MSHTIFKALLIGLCVYTTIVNCEVFDPYENGPHKILFKHYNLSETELLKHVDIWSPQEAGEYPVILFSGSLAGNVPGDTSVITVIQRVVSWGFVIINPWKIYSTPGDNYHVNYIDPILEYLRPRIEDDLIAIGANPGLSVNTDRMIIMGHSSGNHINVNYLKEHCGNFTAAILLSPVDGTDPYGLIQDFAITPGQKLNFEIPSLVMQAGLDPVKGNILYPACAPAKLANLRFYDAMAGDRWYVNASEYGHVDFFEPDFVGAVDFLNFCGTDSETNKTVYRDFVGGSIVAFSKAILEPEKYCDMLSYVEDTDEMIVNTNVQNDIINRCQEAQCNWSEPPATTTSAY